MSLRLTWALCISLLMAGACTQSIAADANTRAEAPPLTFIEHLTGGATASQTLPLIIAIHGLGDTPEEFVTLFENLTIKARVIAPRAPDAWGEGSSWYPIDDETTKPRVIRARAKLVSELVTRVMRTRPTQGKPVVIGFSQGGVLSFAMAAYHSHQLRAALPIAGSLPEELYPTQQAAAGFELIAFHGRVDQRILFEDGDKTLRALNARGHRGVMHAFDGVGHNIPPIVREAIFAALRKTLPQVTSTPSLVQ